MINYYYIFLNSLYLSRYCPAVFVFFGVVYFYYSLVTSVKSLWKKNLIIADYKLETVFGYFLVLGSNLISLKMTKRKCFKLLENKIIA